MRPRINNRRKVYWKSPIRVNLQVYIGLALRILVNSKHTDEETVFHFPF